MNQPQLPGNNAKYLFVSPSRNISLNMEPSTSTACDSKKRKNNAPAGHETAKRLKTGQEDDEAVECGRTSCSPRISVLPESLQQAITQNELMELLHYAALGKTGGIKHPR